MVEQQASELETARRLALQFSEAGDLVSALNCLERCADWTPESLDIQLALGRTLQRLGNRERALGHLQCALALDPQSVEVCWRLVEVLHQLKRQRPARNMARRIVVLRPRWAVGHTLCGNLAFEEREFGDAIECYAQALALEPANAEARCQLGHTYFRLGRVEEAIECYRAAAAAAPADPVPHSALVYAAGFHPSWGPERIGAEASA